MNLGQLAQDLAYTGAPLVGYLRYGYPMTIYILGLTLT